LVSMFPSFPRYKEVTCGRRQIEPGPPVVRHAASSTNCRIFNRVTMARDRMYINFRNELCHIIKNLLTSTVRAVRENIQPRYRLVSTYSKTSVGCFPVLASLSVSKLLIFDYIFDSHRFRTVSVFHYTSFQNIFANVPEQEMDTCQM
jgi:hypothetical protein